MDEPIFDQIVTDLRSNDVERAVQAIYRLEKVANEAHLPQLRRLLNDDDFFVREAAAHPYARLLGVQALPLLLQAQIRGYDDGHDNDGLDAVITELVETHKPEATPILLDMLTSDNPKTRGQATWLLGFVASEIEPGPLLNALNDEQPEVRANAAGALSSFENHPPVCEALIDILSDSHEGVRVSAASALGYLGDKRALPALQSALNDPSEQVCRTAASAIEQLKKPKKTSGD